MKLNRNQWVLVIVLLLLFFPEFDNYSQKPNDVEQWQFGDLRYRIHDDCWYMLPQPKNRLFFNSFFTRGSIGWGDCDDDFYSGRGGISFAIKDPFYAGYDVIGISIKQNYGAISIMNKWLPTIWLWE